jgi:Tfp pilus assembly protein PilN
VVRRFNLVPPSERRRTKTDVGRLAILAATILVLGAIGSSYLYLTGIVADREMQLAELKLQRSHVDAQLASLSEYEVLQQQVNTAELTIQRLYASRTLVSEVLGDLSLVVPPDVWFTSFALSTPPDLAPTATAAPVSATAGVADEPLGEIAISGTTYTFEDVARLLVRLEQVSSLKDVALSQAGVENKEGLRQVTNFTIVAKLANNQSSDVPLPITEIEVKAQ